MTHVGMLLTVALTAVASLAHAGPQQAHTVVISAEPVFLRVHANGVPMRLKIANGGMGRISSGTSTVGLSPKITAAGVEIHVFDIAQSDAPGAERIKEIAHREIVVGAPEQFSTDGFSMQIELLDRAALPPLPAGWRTTPGGGAASTGATPTGPCVQCCVTCDGTTACACEVWMDCGHCCCSSEACGQCIG